MSFVSMLRNRVVHELRSTTLNSANEEVEAFDDLGDPFPASVQDRADQVLNLPDVDGPTVINAVIFTTYAGGLDVRHLDVLRQTDVDPPRRYRVMFPKDAAGRHHHFEMQCQRVQLLPAVPS